MVVDLLGTAPGDGGVLGNLAARVELGRRRERDGGAGKGAGRVRGVEAAAQVLLNVTRSRAAWRQCGCGGDGVELTSSLRSL